MDLAAGTWWASSGALILFGLWRDQVDVERLSFSAAVQYFDFPGSEPFVSEAALSLKLGAATLKAGRFPVAWEDGLVHHDLWTGTDGVLLQLENWEVGTLKPRGEWIGIIRWKGIGVAVNASKLWAWAGFTRGPGKAELAVNHSLEWAGVLELKGGYPRAGLAFLAFSEHWENLGGFPIIFDDLYNGWTGLGDAFTWAAMMDSTVASEVSSAQGGSVGVFWPDMRNILAGNLNASLGPLRIDWFLLSSFKHEEKAWLCSELSANAVLRTGSFTGGVGVGFVEDLKDQVGPYKIARVWGEYSVSFGKTDIY